MSYKLKFLPSAWKEWEKLGETVRQQFKKMHAGRLEQPVVAADRLRGQQHYFKIKLRSAGYRLVYEVEENRVTVYVIAVGKRDKETAYRRAAKRKRP
jgi:mRNA interferase RelE/StbE